MRDEMGLEKKLATIHPGHKIVSLSIRPYATGFLALFYMEPKSIGEWSLPEERVAFFNGGGNLAWDLIATVYHEVELLEEESDESGR